ncbi:YopX family protein [Listeria innocua]
MPDEIDGIKITREDPEDFDTRFYFDASVDSAAMTVIGNIHENPELMEEK